MSDVSNVNNVYLTKSAVDGFINPLKHFQNQMKGEAEKAGLFTEDNVANWIHSLVVRRMSK